MGGKERATNVNKLQNRRGVPMPRVNANGVELYYEEAGEGTPLILQAHALLPWLQFQVPFFAQRYRVITLDRRGTGRSALPEGDWTVADFTADVRGLMDALGIERAIIGGASLGGMIACQFGLDYPTRALALVIGHTVPYLWPLAREWNENLMAAMAAGDPGIPMQPRSYDWEAIGPPSQNPDFATAPFGKLLAASARVATVPSGGAAAKMARAIDQWDIRPRYAELNALTVPALVIVGGHEPQKTVELAYEWHREMPKSEFFLMPDAYHGAAREQPIEWNSAVLAFLQRHGQ